MGKKLKNLILLIIAVVIGSGFFFVNNSTNIHYLASTLDNKIPFIPIFIFPYLIFIGMFWIILFYAFAKKNNFLPLVLSIIIVYLISYIVYTIFPTCVYRPTVDIHGFISQLVKYLYAIDRPCNDFPSIHNSSVAILAVYFYYTNKKANYWYGIFALFVILSTVFLKQHNIVDVISGLAIGFFVSYFVFRRFAGQE